MQADQTPFTTPIYSIGHRGRERQDLVAILRQYAVRYLIDVRSDSGAEQYSDFSVTPLTAALKEADIAYVGMGDTLGEKVSEPDAFDRGLERLRKAVDGGHVVALFSDESDPDKSHRPLIGRALAGLGIEVVHIDARNQPLSQSALAAGGRAAAPTAANAPTTPTLADARRKLKDVFGYDDFLPMQSEVIESVLARRDTLAIMPTGGGKSLCYQLPALLFPGLTIVVSPLISLMQDQVDQLRDNGIAAAFLNSTLTRQAQQSVMNAVRGRKLKLLYVAPESLLRDDRLDALAAANVSCLTIDEAHCISQWGHDFRPEYRQLRDVRSRLQSAVTVALTATATARVRADIRQSLGLTNPAEFVAGFDRPNLNLIVRQRTDGLNQLAVFLRKRPGQSGIVYCLTKKTVEEVAEELQQCGFGALPYHAGFETEQRLAAQRAFAGDEVPIIVATVAFGMGINKPNVRFVVHYNLPQSLESYYQEIGRAGRDGLPADCLLLTSDSDLYTIRRFYHDKEKPQRDAAEARLQAMLGYIQSRECRRRPLLRYFAEQHKAESCGKCDRCLERASKQPTDSRPREKQPTALWSKDEQSAASPPPDKQPQPAAAKRPSESRLPMPERLPYQTTYDPALLEYLMSVRKEEASKAKRPSYELFSSKALREMATYFPHSMESLLQIREVTLTQAERYGQPMLEAIRSYCARHGITERRR